MPTLPDPTPTPSHPLNRPDRRVGALRLGFRLLGRIAPGPAAHLAEALFVKTARPEPRPYEAEWLGTAERFTVRAAGETIAGYSWGEGPVVLMAHGWWSHAGRFTPLARAVVDGGMRAVAFDAPGHGQSTGWRATMPEFAASVEAVAAHQGSVHAVVGHSLGGAANILAMDRGLRVNRAVTIAAPADIPSWVLRFRDTFGISERVYAGMQRNMERRLQVTWQDLDIPVLARRLAIPGLVVHDRHDPDVPWSDGETLAEAWPNARLHTTERLGHRSVLRDPAVVRRVVEFLGER